MVCEEKQKKLKKGKETSTVIMLIQAGSFRALHKERNATIEEK